MKSENNKIPLRGFLARSVALLFTRSGILPRSEENRTKDSATKLIPILKDGWHYLRKTNATADKYVLFFGVILYIIIAYLFLISTVAIAVTSVAHAQTVAGSSSGSSSIFQAASPDQDLAQNWLQYLFFAKDISSYVSPAGQIIPQATNIQTALQTALGVFSNAMLIIAAIILFYHLTAMVVETAHHGVVMGKRANQIWAPIRLVVALGLLVPVSGGLNSGQYIVIKIAEMGSGLASNVWSTFLTALASQGMTYHAPNAPYVRHVVEDLVKMEACRLTYNYYVAKVEGALNGTDLSNELVSATVQPINYIPIVNVPLPGGTTTLYTNNILGHQGMCGSYTIGAVPSSPAGADPNNFENQIPQAIAKAHIQTIQSLLSGGQITAAAKNVKYFINDFDVTPDMPGTSNGFTSGDNGTGLIPSNSAIDSLSQTYQANLQNAITSAVGSLYDNSLQTIAQQWSAQGWVTAGAWFNTIARSQGAIVDAAQDGLPQTSPPKVATMSEPSGWGEEAWAWMTGLKHEDDEAYNLAHLTAQTLKDFDIWAGNADVPASGGSSSGADAFQALQQKMNDAAAGEANSGFSLIDLALKAIDSVAIYRGVWSSGPLAFSFTNTANPLAELSYLGHNHLGTGFDLYAIAGAGAFASGLPLVGKGIGFITSTLCFIATVFIAGGFTLAFLVPLLPFIWFFFNVLTWVLMVLEAVVLVPMFALGHLNAEGDGLPGNSARSAYFLILNIFLRPVLMIFGLVCGLLLFFVAISFLNMVYTIATAGTGASAGGFTTVAKIVFSVMYVGLAYICANHCFKAIGYFPEHALRWIGSSGHQESMGTPDHMGAIMTGVAAYGGQRVGESLQKPGLAVGQAMQSSRDNKTAEKKGADEKRQAIELADKRHVQNLAHQAGQGVKDFKNDADNQQYIE